MLKQHVNTRKKNFSAYMDRDIDDLMDQYMDEYLEEEGIVIIEMSDFDNYFDSPLEAVRAAHFGDFNPTDSYFTFDGYDNVESYRTYDNAIEDLVATNAFMAYCEEKGYCVSARAYDALLDFIDTNKDIWDDYSLISEYLDSHEPNEKDSKAHKEWLEAKEELDDIDLPSSTNWDSEIEDESDYSLFMTKLEDASDDITMLKDKLGLIKGSVGIFGK